MPPNLVGQTLGKYQLTDRLGRGGMADVYKAYQPGLERYVAIKVLHPHLSEQPDFVARFKREAQSVSALQHPNIVQVFDFDIQGDTYYMAMAYIEGGRTLKEVLKECASQGERLPFEQTLELTAQVADALQYAHRRGMIHRDVKPANILIQSIDHPILSDFGIAHLVDVTTLTRSGAMVGTPAYMPPEQGSGGKVTERTDIYALGITLYEMLTGKPPYDADTPYGVIMKHISDPLIPPHLVASVPEAVEPVVLKALAKRPEDRFATAGDMADALRRAGAALGGDGAWYGVPVQAGQWANEAHGAPQVQETTRILGAYPDNSGTLPEPATTSSRATEPATLTRKWDRKSLLSPALALGVIVLIAEVLALVWRSQQPTSSIPAAPPGMIYAAEIDGHVALSVAGGPEKLLRAGDTVEVGSGDPSTTLTTGDASRAVISLDDGSVLYVGPMTTINLDQLVGSKNEQSGTLLTLQEGVLLARVTVQPGSSFVIRTPAGTRADVFGSLMGTSYGPNLQQFDVDCLEGHCRLFGGPGIPPVELTACQHSRVTAAGTPDLPDRAASEVWRGMFQDAAPECPTAEDGVAIEGKPTTTPTVTPTLTATPTASPTLRPSATVSYSNQLPTATDESSGVTELAPVETLLPTLPPIEPTSIIPPIVPPVVPTVKLLP